MGGAARLEAPPKPELRYQDQEALVSAFNELAIARGLSFIPDADDPAAAQRGIEAMLTQHALLEPVNDATGIRSRSEPALTACMPVAILKEKQTTVLRAANVFAQAQQQYGRPVELILWTNAKYNEGDQRGDVDQSAREQYERLREQLQRTNASELTIKTALQVLPKYEATMTKLRSNYMDAVAIDAIKREYGYSHPILWLDADLSFMSRGTLAEIESGVRNFDALLVHPETIFTADWANGTLLSNTDIETRAFATCEIQRRQIARRTPASKILSHFSDYFEECGLACAIGTFCNARGLNTDRAIGESASLIANVDSAQVPDFLIAHRDNIPPKACYKRGVRIGMEGRRHYEIIKALGSRGLVSALSDQAYNETCIESDFTQYWGGKLTPPPITRDHLMKIPDYLPIGSELGKDQRRILELIIDRYFEPTE
jgi:hypothetical protein